MSPLSWRLVRSDGLSAKRLFDVGQCAVGIAGIELDQRAQSQILIVVRPRAIDGFDLILRDGQLLLCCRVVVERAIERDQVHVQLDPVERPFTGSGGQVGNGSPGIP